MNFLIRQWNPLDLLDLLDIQQHLNGWIGFGGKSNPIQSNNTTVRMVLFFDVGFILGLHPWQ